MEFYRTTVPLGEDQTIRLEIPCDLPPGPVQVFVVYASKPRMGHPLPSASANGEPSVWDNLDPQEWIDILRSGDDLEPYFRHWREKRRNDAAR